MADRPWFEYRKGWYDHRCWYTENLVPCTPQNENIILPHSAGKQTYSTFQVETHGVVNGFVICSSPKNWLLTGMRTKWLDIGQNKEPTQKSQSKCSDYLKTTLPNNKGVNYIERTRDYNTSRQHTSTMNMVY